jgi:hypothetical protein
MWHVFENADLYPYILPYIHVYIYSYVHIRTYSTSRHKCIYIYLNRVRYLQMEQSKYGDMLLAPDYDVADSYFTLTEKTVAFMHWATSPAFQERLGQVRVDFLIMSDDDVYVDLRELAAMMAFADIPRHRYYAGEVRSTHCDTRNTSSS